MVGVVHEEDVLASEYVRGQDSKGAQDRFSCRKGKLALAPYLLT